LASFILSELKIASFCVLRNKFLCTCCFSIISVGNISTAGNLSLYSFTEGAADEGMPNLTSGDENVAIGDEALKRIRVVQTIQQLVMKRSNLIQVEATIQRLEKIHYIQILAAPRM
jgi:hypothetical protein